MTDAEDKLKVEQIAIADLVKDPANVRTHDERNIEAIMGSLRRFGQRSNIVVSSDGVVVAGNGRLEAARRLGWQTIWAERSQLKGSEATAFAIADNRTAELAGWDETGLAEHLRALQSEDFDLDAIGYTDDEVDAMIGGLANGILGPEADGREYDESIADEVQFHECPQCGHRFPK